MGEILLRVIGTVRRKLRYPDETMIGDGDICEEALEKLAFFQTELNITDQNWFVEKWPLIVQPDKAVYNITADNWGRGIFLRTVDPTNPNFRFHDVKFVDYQDLDKYQSVGIRYASSQHTAEAVSQIRTGGNLQLVITPVPNEQASYEAWFEPSQILPGAMDDNIEFLDAFVGLLSVSIALPLLPDCEYDDKKHGRIEKALMMDYELYRKQFDDYKNQAFQEEAAPKRCFGDEWEESVDFS
jgi:hypothetical protein